MDDKRYANLALILAVTSFILSNSFLALPFIGVFSEFPGYIFIPLVILGLLSSLPIAIIARRMSKRMKGSFTMIKLTRIFSLLAIIAFSCWFIMTTAALLDRLAPRGY
jgi:hypothetical protein